MLDDRSLNVISDELRLPTGKILRTIELLENGATIPFIARYRKDITGNLNEVQIESIAERHQYFSTLAERRKTILDTIESQGQLTPELRETILACTNKTRLEDLYLPYKKQRRTKATVAKEKGLVPLAEFLWAQDSSGKSIDEYAAEFVRPEKAVLSVEDALEGARQILAERISVDPELRALVRERMLKGGSIAALPTKNCEGKHTKYEAYYAFTESVARIPSHRFLAIHRGVKEGFLRMELHFDDASMINDLIARALKSESSEFAPQIRRVVEDAYTRLLRPSIENEAINFVQQRADEDAIRVFRENADSLLLSPPAGPIPVIGIDPGFRTGCKIAVVDATGMFVESAAIFPTPPQNDVENAEKTLLDLVDKHGIKAIAIGNGTGSRELARFIRQTLAKRSTNGLFMVLVNEAGASVYSASKVAREEFPQLDVTIRGAISIARRLQDPLAELVKIEPRHIGVGQYQHDVNQKALREGLHRTVVSCVNRVGVDLNTASVSLLRYVSGIQSDTAANLVHFRSEHGGIHNRQQLLDVPGIGPKAFEQCAGFLRIRQGDNPLDATGIHPEAYPIVERMASSLGITVKDLVSNPEAVDRLDLHQFVDGAIGLSTLHDVCEELKKPGRDPRREFKAPRFLDGVESVQDLEEGMEIEGMVTNVTDFGAFVDIGVHQDGLVHLSELANKFVQDPRDVVKVGEVVNVKVIKVDKTMPRISLSIKALLPPPEPRPARPPKLSRHKEHGRGPKPAPAENGQQTDQAERGDKRRERKPDRRRDKHEKVEQRKPARRDRQQTAALKSAVRAGQKQSSAQRPVHHGDDQGPLNTQLADQLAALRSKLGG